MIAQLLIVFIGLKFFKDLQNKVQDQLTHFGLVSSIPTAPTATPTVTPTATPKKSTLKRLATAISTPFTTPKTPTTNTPITATLDELINLIEGNTNTKQKEKFDKLTRQQKEIIAEQLRAHAWAKPNDTIPSNADVRKFIGSHNDLKGSGLVGDGLPQSHRNYLNRIVKLADMGLLPDAAGMIQEGSGIIPDEHLESVADYLLRSQSASNNKMQKDYTY